MKAIIDDGYTFTTKIEGVGNIFEPFEITHRLCGLEEYGPISKAILDRDYSDEQLVPSVTKLIQGWSFDEPVIEANVRRLHPHAFALILPHLAGLAGDGAETEKNSEAGS